ncbi:MAG: PQQ-dependent sugar dehydrogenase [Bacteroidota bacterium]
MFVIFISSKLYSMRKINLKNILGTFLIIAFSATIISSNTSCGDNTSATADSTKVATHDAASTGNKNEEEQSSLPAEELFKKYGLDQIKLPAGFSISVFAQVPNARSMCWGEKGTLFVGNRDRNNVYAVVDNNNDGRADKVYVIATGLNMPCGVAFRNGSLYVGEVSRITRYDNIENNLSSPPKPVVVYDKLPTEKHHGWKFIAFGPDGKLYVPIGAPCNICLPDSMHACIARMNPDGTGFEVFARGIRNSVGLAWDPRTKDLWFTDNGRDNLGDDIPNCELNHAPHAGMHFGYPFCHQGDILDPEYGKGKKCSDYTAPAQKMGPHVAPLGLRFYTASQFPAEYKNKLFIAQHGSWNRTAPIGYRVMMATINNNNVVKYEPFAEGWLQPNKKVIGRPVDIETTKDGSLLISDDQQGAIYKVTYKK